jgi:segregation and condensation protein A
VSAQGLFSKGDMALNSIDSMNIPNQENYVQEAEVDGIEILVNMAKQGKIDPWNVNIVDVTDKYLMHLFKSKAQNLRLTGRTLLFAAILLKLKSNVLEGLDINDFEPQHDDEMYFPEEDELDYTQEDYIPTNNVISIDEVLQRRTSVRLNHNRVVTLRDLIRQLEFYEQLDKKQALKNSLERAARRRGNSISRMTTEDIFKMQHDEYIAEGVARLKDNLEEILNRQERIELNELTLLGMDRISAYISLLFLTVDSDYDLEQDEFYSDLYVIKRPQSENVSDELEESIDNAKNILAEQEVDNGAVEIQN